MSTFKKIAVVFVFFCVAKNLAGQCSNKPYPVFTAHYDCTLGPFITYTVSGGVSPFSYTIVDPISSSTVASGSSAPISGTINANFLPNVQYNVTFTDMTGCSYTGNYQPSPSIFTSSTTGFVTSSVSCNGEANGGATATPPASFGPTIYYSWSPGLYTTSSVSNLPAGIYSVTISDTKGCLQTSTVAIIEPPPIVSTLSNTFINCFGGTESSTVLSTGNVGATTYTVNGIALTPGSPVAQLIYAGAQIIISTDSKGCVSKDTVYVAERAQAFINFTVTSPSCPKTTDGAVVCGISNSSPPYTYSWQPGNSNTQTLQNISSGSYSLTVHDGNACVTSSVIAVVPSASAIVTFTTVKEHCSAMDGSFTLSASGVSPPFTFTTIPGGISGNTGSNVSSGNYTTIINYNTTCIDSISFVVGDISPVTLAIQNSVAISCYSTCTGSVQLSVQGAVQPVTYSATGVPSTTNTLISGFCAGFYVIKAIDNIGCPATATVYFDSPPVFSYTATAPPSACAGQAVTLLGSASGGTGPYKYVWNPPSVSGQVVSIVPSGTTVYSLNAYDSNNCTLAPQTVTVSVLPLISVSINSSNAGICPGTTAQITPTVSGGDGNYTYLWLPGNSQGASIFVENVQIPIYTLTVNDGCGSPTAVISIPINLFPVIQPIYRTSGSKGCEPYCTEFVNLTPKSTHVIWNYGDQPHEQTGDTTSHCYQKAGLYNLWLSLMDSNNCRTSFTYTHAIEILQSPLVDFITDPARLTLKNSANTHIQNITNYGSSYAWFKDGKLLAETADIYYMFSDTGCYNFMLIAKNENQCVDTLQKSICVGEGFNFYMPTCFTPNGNGLNDVFLPKGTGWMKNNYQFEIYNRWGNRLFKTEDTLTGWDGTNGGRQTPMDSYIWRVVITDTESIEHVMEGSVTLLH